MPTKQIEMLDLLAAIKPDAIAGSGHLDWHDPAMQSQTSYFEQPAGTECAEIQTLHDLLDDQPSLLLALADRLIRQGNMPTADLVKNVEKYLSAHPQGLPPSKSGKRRLTGFVYPVY